MPKQRTTKEFIEKAHQVHGDRYDYSLVEYTKGTAPVTILCSAHGAFDQTPAVHLRGCGCPRCGREQFAKTQTKTTNEFVTKARRTHGDRYDYSLAEYIKGKLPVIIVCKTHGPFQQAPTNHLQGAGCVLCGHAAVSAARSLTQQDFLERATELHGDRYDYSLVEYRDTKTVITIVCVQHGPFDQTAGDHLQGKGCSTCGVQKIWESRGRPTTDEFIKKAQQKQGDRYDYSRADYQGSRELIEIGCLDHGWFQQAAGNHLQGRGCPTCGQETQNEKKSDRARFQRAKTAVAAIHDATTKHEGKYRYLGWEDDHSTLVIRCPDHGVFRQDRRRHLRGQGCPECARNLSANTRRSTTEEFVGKAQARHGTRYNYSEVKYHHCEELVTIVCLNHGEFDQKPSKHLEGSGCPKCRVSRGEEIVMLWLQQHSLEFYLDWTNHDCTARTKPARFDFCLPNYKVLIEYDGLHHFKPILNWYGGHKQTPEEAAVALKRVQTVDGRKNTWAENNGYQMIRIRYDEDVAEILNQKLFPRIKESRYR